MKRLIPVLLQIPHGHDETAHSACARPPFRKMKSLIRALWPAQKTRHSRRARDFQYRLPTYLVAFPRSGTNFLQGVLEASSGLQCRSLYALPHTAPTEIFNFKSHALSYTYLVDEVRRLICEMDKPEKVILLQRDPRDVIVSFYEFVQARKDVPLAQNTFLNETCFFWATFLDKDRTLDRRVELAPLSVAEAYRRHVNEWYVAPPPDISILRLRFEDLVTDPASEFARVFDFLNLDCSLSTDSLSAKVSQYSTTDRERGEPYGWRQNVEYYPNLLAKINATMAREIRLLGYDVLS